MSSTPQEYFDSFISSLKKHNGSVGNGKLQATLGWSDVHYTSVRSALVAKGMVRIGRGRGGTVILVSDVPTVTVPEYTPKVTTNAILEEPEDEEQKEEQPSAIAPVHVDDSIRAGKHFDLEAIKSKYAPLPEDPAAFEVGMHVFRPPTYLFTKEADAWKNLRQYVVVGHNDRQVILKPHNVKDATPESANPKGFFVSNKVKLSKAA